MSKEALGVDNCLDLGYDRATLGRGTDSTPVLGGIVRLVGNRWGHGTRNRLLSVPSYRQDLLQQVN
ncbi:MAG: hypothetical protein H3Z53_12785 [archaeon]|nr:hypothetical protein [archaeon]